MQIRLNMKKNFSQKERVIVINIYDFDTPRCKEVDKKELEAGRRLFKHNEITNGELSIDGMYSFWLRPEKDRYYGTRTAVELNDDGEITNSFCSCQRLGDDSICRHQAACMFYIKENFRSDLEKRRKIVFQQLMNDLEPEDEDDQTTVVPVTSLLPVITMKDNEIQCSLKAGNEKFYAVPSIPDLKAAFESETTMQYGKKCVMMHRYSDLDEDSKRLLDVCYYIYTGTVFDLAKTRNKAPRKYITVRGKHLDNFFRLFNGRDVEINGEPYSVRFKNPHIYGEIVRSDENGYSVRITSCPDCFGAGKRCGYIDHEKRRVYITDAGFSGTALKLISVCLQMKSLYISNDNMQAFYSGVLKPVLKYIEIKGADKLDEYVPPELEAHLYIDCIDDGVSARPEFTYGDKKFSGFYDQKKNPFCDYKAERLIKNTFLKFFTEQSTKEPDTWFLHGDSALFELLTSGLTELESCMEVFVSDAFKKIGVRAPARPAIGIRPSGSLLALDITAEGYTTGELVEMLKSYRRGAKYHRLKDGSFALLTDAMTELSDVAENLNISEKQLLKENLKVPKYRMLYLDSLKKNCENLRINRSAEFKKIVSSYGMMMEDSEQLAVPDSLESVMREYQKYGFRWMKTISAYHFGGILADDMGLGKTLQAISLILDNKHDPDGMRKPSLVVCPASLTLNWKNEINRFAPELSVLTVIGTVQTREELFADIDKYDVIVTPYSLLTRDVDKYENTDFAFQFIDEAQYIKNQNTQAAKAVKSINAEVKFALTGTPVENSLAELWSIFDYIMPDYLFGYTYFRKNFEAPITAKKETRVISELQKVISPFILRRMKKEVLKELPDKTETIMYANMGEEQSRVYSANVADVKKTLAKDLKDGADRIKILAMLTRLRQICCDPSLVYDNYEGGSAKLEQCIDLVSSCVASGHKILLFSQFTSMLDIISKRLDEEGISYYTITGQTKPADRILLVNDFNNDDTSVFLISLKAGGTGLNLTGADIVIHYDPWWNLSAENQASDRAYRIGQKKNVQIYKLITDRTIEEKIIELQTKKAELYDIAVNGEGDIMRMSADDIMSILE